MKPKSTAVESKPEWAGVLASLKSLYPDPDVALEEAAKGIAHNSQNHREMTEAIDRLRQFAHWCIERFMDKDPDVGDQAMRCDLISPMPTDFDPDYHQTSIGEPVKGDEWYEATNILGEKR